MFYVSIIFQKKPATCCHLGGGGGEKKLDILGGDPEKNGNF